MKHEFKEGDGMRKETSTPEEKKEIFELLHNEGYNVNLPSGTRVDGNLEKSLLFYRDEFIISCYDGITNNYTYQQMKDLILGKEETITVTRSELSMALIKLWEGDRHIYSYVDDIIESVSQVQCELPTIELKGANKEINFAVNISDGVVYGSKEIPYLKIIPTIKSDLEMWVFEGLHFDMSGFNKNQFKSLKAMDWKESLHKVKHI